MDLGDSLSAEVDLQRGLDGKTVLYLMAEGVLTAALARTFAARAAQRGRHARRAAAVSAVGLKTLTDQELHDYLRATCVEMARRLGVVYLSSGPRGGLGARRRGLPAQRAGRPEVSAPALGTLAEGLTDEQVDDVRAVLKAMQSPRVSAAEVTGLLGDLRQVASLPTDHPARQAFLELKRAVLAAIA